MADQKHRRRTVVKDAARIVSKEDKDPTTISLQVGWRLQLVPSSRMGVNKPAAKSTMKKMSFA